MDFRNTVLILTSNVGASERSPAKALGFSADASASNTPNAQKERMMNALKHTFRPEFLNRIDDIIVFNALLKGEVQSIARILLENLNKRLAKQVDMTLVWDEEVLATLAENGYEPQYGARPLRRLIGNLVETQLSKMIVRGQASEGDTIRLVKDGDTIRLARA